MNIQQVILSIRAIILDKNSNKILLLQRCENERHDALKWEFPGGKPNNSSESFKEVITREVKEETNLNIDIIDSENYILYSYEVESGVYTGYRFIQVIYLVAISDIQECKISDEHKSYKFIDFNQINFEEMSNPIRKGEKYIKNFLKKFQVEYKN